MSKPIVRCKHLKELKFCLPCLYGTLVAKEARMPLMTEHEKRVGLAAMKLLLQYRNRIRELRKPPQVAVALLKKVCETRLEYVSLVLAWRVAFKAETPGNRSAEEMAATLASRLLAQAPQGPSGKLCEHEGCETPVPDQRARCGAHAGLPLAMKAGYAPLTQDHQYQPILGDRLGYFVRQNLGSVVVTIPRAEALLITHEFQNCLKEGRINQALSISLTMKAQGYLVQVNEIAGPYGAQAEAFTPLYEDQFKRTKPPVTGVPLKQIYLGEDDKKKAKTEVNLKKREALHQKALDFIHDMSEPSAQSA